MFTTTAIAEPLGAQRFVPRDVKSAVERPVPVDSERRGHMLKFIGGTIGAIFLIGLIVVVLLLMLIF
jgi:hypothetical protein